MRTLHDCGPIFALACVAALAGAAPAAAGDARVQIDVSELSALGPSSAVNISVDKDTIGWAAKAIAEHGGDEAELRELMTELDGIYVTAFEYEEDDAPTPERLAAATKGVIEKLDGPGWSTVVSVAERGDKGQELVRISLYNDEPGKAGGLTVFVLEPDEVVLVNIVGPVKLEQLARIGKALGKSGMFGAMMDADEGGTAKDELERDAGRQE